MLQELSVFPLLQSTPLSALLRRSRVITRYSVLAIRVLPLVNLRGTGSPSTLAIRRLRSLLLNNNRISSFAPNTNRSAVWESAAGASSRVTRLRQLDLSHNRLKRLAAEATIAGEKTRLSGFLRNSFALDYLDVSHNSLTTQGLPTDLGKMTKLVELDLSSNSLSFLPEYLALSSLRVLNVGKSSKRLLTDDEVRAAAKS